MKSPLIAKRYARAFAQAALRKEETETFYSELKNFASFLSQIPSLSPSLVNPGIPVAKKKELLEKLIGSEILQRLILYLIKRNNLRLLPAIVHRVQELLDEHHGISRAAVHTALALSFEQKEKLTESLKDFFQRPILIEETVDSNLLAGMVIHVGDTVIDNSLKGQLAVLERQLRRQDESSSS